MNYQTFVLGAAGDIKDELPSGLEGFGTEDHWQDTVKRINSSTSMCSAECLFCCPCFTMMMVCGGGVEKHLSQKVNGVMIKLNREHYNGDEVFSNEGLKICFDRNKVSRDFYTTTMDGKVVLDEKQQQAPGQTFTVFNGGPNRPMQAPVQQAPAQQIPVQPVQMQARPNQVMPVHTPMQQPMQQQPMYQQPMQQQPVYQQQPLQQQPVYQQQPMQQQQIHYQQQPPQQQMHRPQVQQQPPQQQQQQNNNQGVGQGIIPTIATIGTIPVVASAMM